MMRTISHILLVFFAPIAVFFLAEPTYGHHTLAPAPSQTAITEIAWPAEVVIVPKTEWKKRSPLRMGSQIFRPIMYLEYGEPKGIQIELQRELMEEAGLAFTQRYLPISRLYHELALGKGNVDAWISSQVPAAEELGFPVVPSIFIELDVSLFGLAGSDPPKVGSFREKRLITIIGFKFNGVIDQLKNRLPDLKILAAHGHSQAFKMLKAGRARYLIDYYLPGIDAAQSLGMRDVAHVTIYKQATSLYISRNVPDAAPLLERLGKASERILARRALQAVRTSTGKDREGGE